MRKLKKLVFVYSFLSIFLVGCSNNVAATDNKIISTEEAVLAAESNQMEEVVSLTTEDGVDIDLTQLSSTMVYGEVYNMVNTPKDYLGKIVKASGEYYASYYEVLDVYYHFLLIADAASCCSQGLEFIIDGEAKYPEDYPKNNEKIEIVGEFSSYEELGETYYYILVTEINIM